MIGKMRPLLLAALLWPAATFALDFTPTEAWRELEGFRIPTLIFQDPPAKVRYQPPGNWRYDGGGDTITLNPEKQQEAFMKMQVLPRKPAAPNDPPEDLQKFSLTALPVDAKGTKQVGDFPSPYMLDGRPSREFVYEYAAGGRRFQTSVSICDLDPKQRLLVIITARTEDFKAVRDDGIASLFSWNTRK